MDENLPDFTGKTVVLYITATSSGARWAQDGIVLESPTFHTQGERLFLTGQTPNNPRSSDHDWYSNRDAGVAWDSVLQYVALPSKDYQARLQVPEKQPFSKNLSSLFYTAMGVSISIALLMGLIIWIIKML